MNWVDLAVLAVLGISALLAFMRGLVRELLGIASWVGSGFFAAWAFPFVKDRFRLWVGRPDIADPLAIGVLFLVAVIVLSVLAGMVAGMVRMSVLSSLDRTLGMVFGLLRGVALVACAYVLVSLAVPVESWPQVVLQARSLPIVYRVAVLATQVLPADYQQKIRSLPAEANTRFDDMLRANPLGKAFVHP